MAALGQADTSPVGVYLGRLAPGSRRGQLDALNTIAGLLTNGSADLPGPWNSRSGPLGHMRLISIMFAVCDGEITRCDGEITRGFAFWPEFGPEMME